MKTVEIQSERRILDGFFKIDEVEFRHQRRDGSMSPLLRRVHLERGDGAAAILHNPEAGTLILVRQFRFSAWRRGHGWMLEAVAGVVGPDQTPEQAMRREIGEETGYRLDEIEPVTVFFLTPGGSSERIFLFYAQVAESERSGHGGGLEVEGEDIEVVEMPVGEVWSALDSGEIADAKTIVGLQWLRRRLESGRDPVAR